METNETYLVIKFKIIPQNGSPDQILQGRAHYIYGQGVPWEADLYAPWVEIMLWVVSSHLTVMALFGDLLGQLRVLGGGEKKMFTQSNQCFAKAVFPIQLFLNIQLFMFIGSSPSHTPTMQRQHTKGSNNVYAY